MVARGRGAARIPGIQELRHERHRPVGYKPELHRAGYVYTKQLPGEYYEVFKQQNSEQDPLMMCAGRKQEIGDSIQMCMDFKSVHVVIYRRATLKALDILFKKIKYHIKKHKGTVSLSEYNRGIIYDNATLRRKTVTQLALELKGVLKKRKRFVRLLLEQSHSGGALHQEWMHKPDTIARISDS